MGIITVSGTLFGGPQSGGETFPAAQFSTPLRLSSPNKGFQNASGILTRVLTNPAVFVAIPAVGTGGDITRANFLYVRSDGDYQLRLTQDDGAGGTTVTTIQCRGLFVTETPDSLAIVGVEIASSSKIELLASGIV